MTVRQHEVESGLLRQQELERCLKQATQDQHLWRAECCACADREQALRLELSSSDELVEEWCTAAEQRAAELQAHSCEGSILCAERDRALDAASRAEAKAAADASAMEALREQLAAEQRACWDRTEAVLTEQREVHLQRAFVARLEQSLAECRAECASERAVSLVGAREHVILTPELEESRVEAERARQAWACEVKEAEEASADLRGTIARLQESDACVERLQKERNAEARTVCTLLAEAHELKMQSAAFQEEAMQAGAVQQECESATAAACRANEEEIIGLRQENFRNCAELAAARAEIATLRGAERAAREEIDRGLAKAGRVLETWGEDRGSPVDCISTLSLSGSSPAEYSASSPARLVRSGLSGSGTWAVGGELQNVGSRCCERSAASSPFMSGSPETPTTPKVSPILPPIAPSVAGSPHFGVEGQGAMVARSPQDLAPCCEEDDLELEMTRSRIRELEDEIEATSVDPLLPPEPLVDLVDGSEPPLPPPPRRRPVARAKSPCAKRPPDPVEAPAAPVGSPGRGGRRQPRQPSCSHGRSSSPSPSRASRRHCDARTRSPSPSRASHGWGGG